MTDNAQCIGKKSYHNQNFILTPRGCDSIDIFEYWKEYIFEGKTKALSAIM